MGRNLLLLLGGVLLVFTFLLVAYFILLKIGGEQARTWLESGWRSVRDLLTDHGPLLFLAIAVLPGFVLPVAPLLGFAGIWAGKNGPWLGCAYCSLALFANLCWTYWLARGPARGLLKRLLSRSRFRLPETPPKNLIEWALILRLTPGVPFILTNYGLGLFRMPFASYLTVSLPILAFTACGYVLAFAGVFGGQWKHVWTGVSILAVTILFGKFWLKRKDRDAR